MLIRNARLVALEGAATTASYDTSEPVDVLVEDGVVTQVGTALAHDDEVYDADGRVADAGAVGPARPPRPVDAVQRPARPRRPRGLRRRPSRWCAERLEAWPDRPVIGWGHRPTAWPEEPRVSMLDAIETDQPIVLIAGDGHHAWLNTTALVNLALPRARRAWWPRPSGSAIYGRLRTILGDDGTGPEAYRRTLEEAAALGVVGLTDFEFSGGVDEWADPLDRGCRPAARPDGDVRRRPRRRHRGAASARATRSPGDDPA